MHSTTTTMTSSCHSHSSSFQRRRISWCQTTLCSLLIVVASSIICQSHVVVVVVVEAAAASTAFSARRTTIASASIHYRPSSSSSSSSSLYYNSYCFARPRRSNKRKNQGKQEHSSRSSRRWPWLSSTRTTALPSLGSYDELCDSLQRLDDDRTSSSRAILASSKAATASAPRGSASKKGSVASSVADAPPGGGSVGYDDLTLLGRCVYGSVEVLIVTATDFASGCFGGYMIGVVTDIPRLLFRSVEQQGGSGVNLLKSASPTSPFWSQVSSRMSRMHGKSWRWGKEWGTISAVFGASRVATKVIRGGKEDEWSTVLSSMAAGAYFARKGMYTFATYLLSRKKTCCLNMQRFRFLIFARLFYRVVLFHLHHRGSTGHD
jgi:Tim17/Tim22/Tim23/Pmp24 family